MTTEYADFAQGKIPTFGTLAWFEHYNDTTGIVRLNFDGGVYNWIKKMADGEFWIADTTNPLVQSYQTQEQAENEYDNFWRVGGERLI